MQGSLLKMCNSSDCNEFHENFRNYIIISIDWLKVWFEKRHRWCFSPTSLCKEIRLYGLQCQELEHLFIKKFFCSGKKRFFSMVHWFSRWNWLSIASQHSDRQGFIFILSEKSQDLWEKSDYKNFFTTLYTKVD